MLTQPMKKLTYKNGLSLVRKNNDAKTIFSDASDELFYSESNMRYLQSIMHDVREGKAHFAEHDLIEID